MSSHDEQIHDRQTRDAVITQLRAEVETLGQMVAARVAKVSQEQAELAERVAATTREQDQIADAIARLEDSVASLTAVTSAAAARTPGATGQEPGQGQQRREPVAWVDHASAGDWVELADWVDWFTITYDLSEDRLVRSCWPAHLGVAEELAALRSAWREAASAARGGDGSALSIWHDRALAPFLGRVATMYGTRSCHATRHSPVMAPRPTDRTMIDVRSAATTTNTDGGEAGVAS